MPVPAIRPAGAPPYGVGVETDQNGEVASARALFVVVDQPAGRPVVYGRGGRRRTTRDRGGKVKRAAAGHA